MKDEDTKAAQVKSDADKKAGVEKEAREKSIDPPMRRQDENDGRANRDRTITERQAAPGHGVAQPGREINTGVHPGRAEDQRRGETDDGARDGHQTRARHRATQRGKPVKVTPWPEPEGEWPPLDRDLVIFPRNRGITLGQYRRRAVDGPRGAFYSKSTIDGGYTNREDGVIAWYELPDFEVPPDANAEATLPRGGLEGAGRQDAAY